MKLRVAVKIIKSNSDYWWQQADNYHTKGIQNKFYLAIQRVIKWCNVE